MKIRLGLIEGCRYDFEVKEVEVMQGTAYIFLMIRLKSVSPEAVGEEVRHVVSLAPRARSYSIQFFKALGFNTHEIDTEDMVGRWVSAVVGTRTYNGKSYQELSEFQPHKLYEAQNTDVSFYKENDESTGDATPEDESEYTLWAQ